MAGPERRYKAALNPTRAPAGSVSKLLCWHRLIFPTFAPSQIKNDRNPTIMKHAIAINTHLSLLSDLVSVTEGNRGELLLISKALS